jgi:hypothetical protein
MADSGIAALLIEISAGRWFLELAANRAIWASRRDRAA